MSQPNLLRYVIEQATRGGKSVVSRRKFSSSHCKFDEKERSVLMDKMKSSTNRRRLLAFLVASSLSFHLWGNVEIIHSSFFFSVLSYRKQKTQIHVCFVFHTSEFTRKQNARHEAKKVQKN
ncbi:hypothetical protein ISN45_Aa03g012080 [Arabidopsis thaliana x Arabidopsis arenosa]|uniref:Transmembrane protein n=1 Tax=Arabidopsis thaliana x Arabidopsis arenosa TaxID=1240361 RepID=A0A8T2AVU3_9BRAS|nr:hypothetical protein ISN45_Aa03g012080 [Arabidopsis thaliana x Arabidopsis arenosa]